MLSVLALAALGCVLGIAAEPLAGRHDGMLEQAIDVLRLLTTGALVLALLLGPGVAWRTLVAAERWPSLGFLPLPGLLLLVGVGGVAWLLADVADPKFVCLAVVGPALGGLLACLLTAPKEEVFDADERRCLLVVGCALGLAAARALWSLGPDGELYGSTVSRTLEVGDRSDSRISFILPQLVADGSGPYGPLGTAMFAPYNFSSRGPLPGLGTAPVVLLSGGRPPAAYPEQPWAPFDAQGFAAYRLAMMTFACTALLAAWDLTRRLVGAKGAYFALLLVATTPFLVHEVWFTWPKLLAATFVLLAAICVISGRPLGGGILVGLGYLMHPVALVSLPALGLIAAWPLSGAEWRRPRLLSPLLLANGIVVFLLAWRLLNGDRYQQSGFLDYFLQAGVDAHPPLGEWLGFRLQSIANTLVPLLLPLGNSDNPSINVVGGGSSPVQHFFFQYWNTLPFGVAIMFAPLLLVALWRALQRWPWPVFATIVVPFVFFAAYWGSYSTGMLREGLHALVLTLLVVVACQQAASGFPWLRSVRVRLLLSLRAVELLAVAAVPTLGTRQAILAGTFALSDTVALLGMLAFTACLGTLVWSSNRTTLAGENRGPTEVPPTPPAGDGGRRTRP